MKIGVTVSVVTATLIAVGISLGTVAASPDGAIPSDFKMLVYTRAVEHGRPTLLGDCPLQREVTIQRNGAVEIKWSAQVAHIHGCAPAIDLGSEDSATQRQKAWDEPVVARQTRRLSQTALAEILDRLDTLRWTPEWTADPSSVTTECSPMSTDSFADRYFAVEDAQERLAILAIYGEESERLSNKSECIADELQNAEVLDAATNPLAPLLPGKFDLSPATARLLNRAGNISRSAAS